MKLVSWNVNGIRAVHKKGLFTPLIEALKPDIICLQETKAEQGQVEIDLLEYEEHWNSSTRKKGYAGTALFTKVKPLTIMRGFSSNIVHKFNLSDDYGDPNAEGRVITAEFKDFYLVNVYTPNSKRDLSRLKLRYKEWDPAFLEHCKDLKQKKPVIFCGDLNVAHTKDDLANPKANEGEHGFTKEEREGIDAIIAAGFADVFRTTHAGNGHYTWWTHFSNARARNIGWRIDYFFVSEKFVPKVTQTSIHPEIFGSDHCPVSIDLSI